MKICRICNKISATGSDHVDCIQQRRIKMEDENQKQSLPEKLDMIKNSDDLGIEIKAILEYLALEKSEKL